MSIENFEQPTATGLPENTPPIESSNTERKSIDKIDLTTSESQVVTDVGTGDIICSSGRLML